MLTQSLIILVFLAVISFSHSQTKNTDGSPRLSIDEIGLRPSLALAGSGHDLPGSSVDAGTVSTTGASVGHGSYGGHGGSGHIVPGISSVSVNQGTKGGQDTLGTPGIVAGQGTIAGHFHGTGSATFGGTGSFPGTGTHVGHVHGADATPHRGSGSIPELGTNVGHVHGVGSTPLGGTGFVPRPGTNVGHVHGSGHNHQLGTGQGTVHGAYGTTGTDSGYGSYGGVIPSAGVGHGVYGSFRGNCRVWCRSPRGKVYCCEGQEHQAFPYVKSGRCPPVRRECIPVKTYRPSTSCNSDASCPGTEKCCFDTCLQQQTCKPNYY